LALNLAHQQYLYQLLENGMQKQLSFLPSLGFGPNFGISDSTWTTYIATVRAAANTIVTSGSGITNTYGSFTNLVANDIIGLAFDAQISQFLLDNHVQLGKT